MVVQNCPNCGSGDFRHRSTESQPFICNKCGHEWGAIDSPVPQISSKSFVTTLLLCLFLGVFGAHRFYVGKPGTAIIFFCTLGGCYVWYFIDLIMIILQKFKDSDGLPIKA